uniref:Uncharacterized protein n=1 Tax=Hordeum vulgare subsp. vulgare TaxID=112509 RepID=A0A8I6X3N7_HORVV
MGICRSLRVMCLSLGHVPHRSRSRRQLPRTSPTATWPVIHAAVLTCPDHRGTCRRGRGKVPGIRVGPIQPYACPSPRSDAPPHATETTRSASPESPPLLHFFILERGSWSVRVVSAARALLCPALPCSPVLIPQIPLQPPPIPPTTLNPRAPSPQPTRVLLLQAFS